MERLARMTFGLTGQPFDPATLAQKKADTLNAVPGKLSGPNCDLCRNRGTVAYPKEDGGIYIRECHCMPARRAYREMEKSGLGVMIREKTFERFQAREDWQRIMLEGAKQYAREPAGWLVFCGQSGSGKTHLCTAVCRQRLLAGSQVRYMSWREDSTRIKAYATEPEQREQLADRLKRAEILYIDDLFKGGKTEKGTENPTSADISLAFEILNYRYINRLPTVLSTEKTPKELVELDEATGSRILEMAGERCYVIARDRRKNHRLRKPSEG